MKSAKLSSLLRPVLRVCLKCNCVTHLIPITSCVCLSVSIALQEFKGDLIPVHLQQLFLHLIHLFHFIFFKFKKEQKKKTNKTKQTTTKKGKKKGKEKQDLSFSIFKCVKSYNMLPWNEMIRVTGLCHLHRLPFSLFVFFFFFWK